MKTYRGVDEYIHIFLSSAVVGGEWSASYPGRLTTGTHWIGSCVGLRAFLEVVEGRKILPQPGLELRPLGCSARSSLRCFLVGGGVQLGPLGTAATDWPIVACPWWLWWYRIWLNEDWQGKPKYSEKTLCPPHIPLDQKRAAAVGSQRPLELWRGHK
jgi:hypothetical protein